ncbi:putative ribonuclease H protein [Sesamum angolense]|uniref:Ribonuclease H protein n=1 Tax=Sesamum angolense TaxID=2727404 RepID=A0AAE1VZU8_9LAMI|nr:putative ribonuclease H protein [Sesamum angolense]
MTYRISHIFREGNQAADLLANQTCSEQQLCIFQENGLRVKVKGEAISTHRRRSQWYSLTCYSMQYRIKTQKRKCFRVEKGKKEVIQHQVRTGYSAFRIGLCPLLLILMHWGCDPLLVVGTDDSSVVLDTRGHRNQLIYFISIFEGHLPVRYLGLPLISARLSIADCQPLLQKIDSRIKGWEGVQISFVGRVQLIKSVLISFEVYWAMAFILPKGIIKEMIKRLRTFLWKGTTTSGYPKVAWEAVCRPIEEGGLGIKDILALNRALMSKHLWAVINRTGPLFGLTGSSRFVSGTVRFGQLRKKGAWGWRKMLSLRHSLISHIHYCVGSGDSVSLWHDPWHPLGPLISRFPRGPQMTRTGLL